MKLSSIRNVGRFINPETNSPVNVKTGRNRSRGTDHLFYLYRGNKVLISNRDFYERWKKAEVRPMASRPVKNLMKEACSEIKQLTHDRDTFYHALVALVNNGSIMRLALRTEGVRKCLKEAQEKLTEYENRSKRASACKDGAGRVYNREARSK